MQSWLVSMFSGQMEIMSSMKCLNKCLTFSIKILIIVCFIIWCILFWCEIYFKKETDDVFANTCLFAFSTQQTLLSSCLCPWLSWQSYCRKSCWVLRMCSTPTWRRFEQEHNITPKYHHLYDLYYNVTKAPELKIFRLLEL